MDLCQRAQSYYFIRKNYLTIIEKFEAARLFRISSNVMCFILESHLALFLYL